jgi:hypothetical protein
MRLTDTPAAAECSCALGDRARTIVHRCIALVGVKDPKAALRGEISDSEPSGDETDETDELHTL